MGKPTFTKMQRAAIDIRNRNILVSAAAGSGKTAVLVQRIIDRVLDEENPVDIDRILVMTFTRAAAAQMKERILAAIDEKKSENPQDKNLNRQYALVHNAYIMTIDSFCMNVVRNHFEAIGLSPDFRMADEGEITLLERDVIEEILEEFYEEGNEEFLKMTEIFAAKKTDTAIEELVLSLYGYAESYPDPTMWLDSCKSADEEYPWLEIYVSYAKRQLNYLRDILDEAGDMCNMDFGPKAYLAAIESDIRLIDDLSSFENYEELYNKCVENADYSFEKLGRLTMPKGDDVTGEEIANRTRLKERVTEIRDKYKKTLPEIVDLVLSMSPEIIKTGMHMMQEPVLQLINLTEAFIDRFNEKKREMNIVDFSDIEHMCLQILKSGNGEAALQYRDFFEEIYVDEYQDSNYVQEEIVNLIAKKSDDNGNVFMVGDVKQSIYGFRNAKPEIFIDKYDRYSKCPDELDEATLNAIPRDVRVDLSHNFRSRIEVLSSVNSIFSKIMTKGLGGIEYDEAASLHKGRDFVATDYDYTTEISLVVSDPDVSDREAEALMVANRIKELMKNCEVEDGSSETGKRALKYSDIVLLLRTAKGWDSVFKEVLESQGIPVFVPATTGYFETIEVKTLLNFLKIIDNPLQDIPLAAVMMSVIGNFYEEEVAIIRGAFGDGYLYEAMVKYLETAQNGTENDSKDSTKNGGITHKIEQFLKLLNDYRRKSEYTAVADVLTEIIDGDYGKIVKAMPGGEKKYANLNMLLKKATEYGKTSYKGIFQFNRYIEAIRKYEIDYGEANLSDESDEAVRIMSIHKSKGLEFPVCFLCGMSKKFNMMDTRATVLTDGVYGIATDVIDIEKRVKSKSLFKISIAKKKQAEIIAEELRLLYVAMTRAKEKLILTGCVKDEESFRNSLVTLDKANSYLDMYFLASDHGEVNDINLSFVHTEDIISELAREEVDANISRNRLISLINNGEVIESDRVHMMRKRLEYKYPYEDKGYVKLSVSELKHRSTKMKDDEAKADDSTKNADVTKSLYEENSDRKIAAKHGTAVHRIFEIWDYNRDSSMESIEQFLSYVNEEMLMEEDYLSLVDADEIYDFLNSDIAKRMGQAFKRGELTREQPFVICDDENDPESMLVQGVIDAYFIEDGEIVVVDYKTDKNVTEKKLIDRHKVQLAYYGKALSRLLHLNLKESVIYSTFLKKSISI